MSQSRLLSEKRFAPFFWTQFLGAFNDSLFKQALVIFFTLSPPADLPGVSRDVLTNVAPALLILPFFLFSATAGQVAEKVEKSRLIRFVKVLEIAIMIAAVIAFPTRSAILLLSLLFFMGLHSTIFGPVKYAILPQILSERELVGGNGLVEMGTYVSVLLGTVLAGILMEQGDWGVTAVSVSVIVAAVLGYIASRSIPYLPAAAPNLKVDLNPVRQTIQVISFARENRVVWLSVLGVSWFWLLGSLFLAQFPGFVVDVLNGSPTVITLLMIVFTLGIGIGSLLCERMSGGHIELGLIPFGSLGITFFSVELYLASAWYLRPLEEQGPLEVLETFSAWRILFSLFMLGLFGGFYSVPLNALIQNRSDPEKRSRILAANNIVNALFMVAASAIAIGGLTGLGLTIPQLLLLVAGIGNALVAIYIYWLLPEFLFRFLTWILMSTMYRLKVVGSDKIPDKGPAVLICNHVSFVDAMILAAAVRRQVRFVMWYRIYEVPLFHWMFQIARAIPVASKREVASHRSAAKYPAERSMAQVKEALEAGELVCIFPEGGLTYTGELMTFRPGVERIVDTTPVPVIPMALRGLWGSFFSRRGGPAMKKPPRRFWSKVELVVGDPIAPEDASIENLEKAVRELRGVEK